MPPASRIGDIGLGHACFPPTPIIVGSSNVIICGSPQGRLGDSLAPHAGTCPSPPHPRNISTGSQTVLTNSLPSGRIGDSVSCGGLLMMGCGTTIFGG